MDISVNKNIVDRVKLRDILASLKNIVVGNKSSEDEIIVDRKLQEVYKAEKEIGATDNIANLVKELEMHETPKKKRTTRNTDKVTKINNQVKENMNSKNIAEIQEEMQEEERQY